MNKIDCSLHDLPDYILIQIFQFCETAPDILCYMMTCTFARSQTTIYKQSMVWNFRPLRHCMSPGCRCGRIPKLDIVLSPILAKSRFKILELCGSLLSLGRCLSAISLSNSVEMLHYSITGITVSPGKLVDFIVPAGLRSKDFSHLTTLTINSDYMQYISLASCYRLFSVLGEHLTSISMWPTTPIGVMAPLCQYGQKIKYIRLDDNEYPEGPCVFVNVEEAVMMNPGRATRIFCPKLKRILVRDSDDDLSGVLIRIEKGPPGMTHIELGDSAAYASNEVLQAIAARYSQLVMLRIISEDKATLITVETMQALRDNCPVLEELDLSRALVWFDEDALEVAGEFRSLWSLCLGFTVETAGRLRRVLCMSRTLREIRFVMLDGSDEAKVEARQYLDIMREHFRYTRFVLENN